MKKTVEELNSELVNLERRLREIKKTETSVKADFKDQKQDVINSMDEVLKEIDDLKVGGNVTSI